MSVFSRAAIFFLLALVCNAHAESGGGYGGQFGGGYGGGNSAAQAFQQRERIRQEQQAQFARQYQEGQRLKQEQQAQFARQYQEGQRLKYEQQAQFARQYQEGQRLKQEQQAQFARQYQEGQRLKYEQQAQYARQYQPQTIYPQPVSPRIIYPQPVAPRTIYPQPVTRSYAMPEAEFSDGSEYPAYQPQRIRLDARPVDRTPPAPPVPIPRSLAEKGWQSPGGEFGRTTNYDGQDIHPSSIAWRVNRDGRVEQLSMTSPDFLQARLLETKEAYAQTQARFLAAAQAWKPGTGFSLPTVSSEADLESWWQANGDSFGRKVEETLLKKDEPKLDAVAHAATGRLKQDYLEEVSARQALEAAVREIERHFALASAALEESFRQSAAGNLTVDQAKKEGERVYAEQRQAWVGKSEKLAAAEARAAALPLGLAIGKKPDLSRDLAREVERLQYIVELRRPILAVGAQDARRENLLREMASTDWLAENTASLDALIAGRFEPGDFSAHIRDPLKKVLDGEAQARATALSNLENSLAAHRRKTAEQWAKLENEFFAATKSSPEKKTALSAQLNSAMAEANKESLAWQAARQSELDRRGAFAGLQDQFKALCDSNELVVTALRDSKKYRLEFDLKRRAYLSHAVVTGDQTRWERITEIQKPRHFAQNGSWAVLIAEKVSDKDLNPQGWLVLLHEGKIASVAEPLNAHTVHWQVVSLGEAGFRVELQDKKTGLPLQEFTLELGLDGQLSPAPGLAEAPSAIPAWEALPTLP